MSDANTTIRWAVLSNTTVAPLVPRLKAALPHHAFHVAEHGEATQHIFSPASMLYKFQPELVIAYWDLELLQPGLALRFAFEPADKRDAILDSILADIVGLAQTLRANSSATILINNFTVPSRTALGIGFDPVFKNAVRQLNLQIAVELNRVPQCFVFDLDSLWAEAGHADRDARFELLAQFPFGPKMQQLLVSEWLRFERALQGRARKCIVVDLDNTLWGGILGEDGSDKLQMADTPAGRPYRRLQEALLALSRRGVLLAIASKNNSAEALAVLRQHPDMVLREEHFVAMQINWDDKATNLTRIVTELNIGHQHVVFLDDNPAERDWVTRAHPEVLAPEFPKDKARYADILIHCELDTVAVTAEDLQRTQMYRQDRQRRAFQAEAPSFDDFLKQLNLEVVIAELQPPLTERAAQLCQRTNQFNVTTRRHTALQLQNLASAPDATVLLMNVRDRFGEYGWSGLAVAKANGPVAEIDTFLVSCRVLGKNVELALFDAVVAWARQRGCAELRGRFIPTAKNSPCADFYSRCGMKPAAGDDGLFSAALAALPPQPINHIKLNHE